MGKHRSWGILVVSVLLILFGLAEVPTPFTHHFFGTPTSRFQSATWLGTATGVAYSIAGFLLLPMRRRLATLSVLLLAGGVLARIAMMAAGVYSMNSFLQSLAMSLGTSFAAFFALFILLKWSSFK